MSINHYENFPVASILLPRSLRQPVSHIYRFARTADDFADEGQASAEERLAALARYSEALQKIESDELEDWLDHLPPDSEDLRKLFFNLNRTIKQHQLGIVHLHDLLSAFSQDVVQTRYPDYDSLLDYCRRSANPVGRLMLELYRANSSENIQQADQICTALQLINFWQDVAIDLAKNRIYLPQESLRNFDVTETSLVLKQLSPQWKKLMRFEIERTRAMMHSGQSLALRLPGRVGFELRLVIQGGLRILEKIEQVEYDVFQRRPQIGKFDWLLMLKRTILM